MSEPIVVLGATGNVGRELVLQLAREGVVPRVLTRSRAADWGVPVVKVVGDLSDSQCLNRVFDSARSLFVVSTIEAPEEQDQRVIDCAVRSGVQHIVKLSSVGAGAEGEIGRRHRLREQAIERSGLSWTFLRPGYFMSNVLQWRESIRTQSKVFAPALDGPVAPISPQDIAAVAMVALLREGHVEQTYVLTGEQLVSARQQIAILAEVLGRPLEAVSLSVEAAVERTRKYGLPGWLAESLGMLWTNVEAGRGALRTNTVRELTGHAPEGFSTWCTRHRAAFS